ncbi:Imm40 family immunity protein [Streptacidiphilus sp. N1-5]|uniref:Imm40 family immunity protein n=1 Tax=Streptacidiphilus cavernicola TaxID=3342716 RepID=A0ABV6UG62_9ACTN
MAHARQEALLSVLPTSVRERSVDLTSVGSAEFAFPVDCLDLVFDTLLENDFVILGGDLWRKVEGEFKPAFDGWYVDALGDSASSAWRKFLASVPSGPDHFATFVVQ